MSDQATSLRPGSKRQMLVGVFGGMIPLLVAVVPFSMGLWGLGLLIVVGGGAFIFAVRQVRHTPSSLLDISSLGFGVLLAIAYFGFGNVFFLQHFGVVIYSLLLLQVVYGEARGEPFTLQYAKKMVSPDVAASRTFLDANRFLSRLWGVIFAAALLMSAFGASPFVLWILPNALVILALVFGPEIGRWYATRFLRSRESPSRFRFTSSLFVCSAPSRRKTFPG